MAQSLLDMITATFFGCKIDAIAKKERNCCCQFSDGPSSDNPWFHEFFHTSF